MKMKAVRSIPELWKYYDMRESLINLFKFTVSISLFPFAHIYTKINNIIIKIKTHETNHT